MHKTLLLSAAAAMAGSAMAQQPVLTLLIPQVDPNMKYLGSVITAEPTATQVSVTCSPEPTATGEAAYCPLGDRFTAKYAKESLEIHMGLTQSTREGNFEVRFDMTMDMTCTSSVPETMTCAGAMSQTTVEGSSSTETRTTTTEIVSDLAALYNPITITAGAEKLSGSGAATPTGGAGSTTPHTGGMPRMTQNAVLAGVAAVVGGVAML